ncbi:MAG TPA: hypothetical protein VGD17_02890 [Chitinophagaceae bacterium]
MKKLLPAIAIIVCLSTGAFAQQPPTESKFMHITTIESVVGGGLGRSKMIITKEDGSQEEKDLENLFSMTGINFKNIKLNESGILQTLKSYTDSGWKLHATIPMTLSPGQNGSGIFMTRYLLVKEAEKK